MNSTLIEGVFCKVGWLVPFQCHWQKEKHNSMLLIYVQLWQIYGQIFLCLVPLKSTGMEFTLNRFPSQTHHLLQLIMFSINWIEFYVGLEQFKGNIYHPFISLLLMVVNDGFDDWYHVCVSLGWFPLFKPHFGIFHCQPSKRWARDVPVGLLVPSTPFQSHPSDTPEREGKASLFFRSLTALLLLHLLMHF